jgi:hypothetical protein
MKVIHVYPVDEENKHEIQSQLYPFCKCFPSEEVKSETLIIKHNSFDGREGVELANEILYKYKH